MHRFYDKNIGAEEAAALQKNGLLEEIVETVAEELPYQVVTTLKPCNLIPGTHRLIMYAASK
jgi:hypothetical protein